MDWSDVTKSPSSKTLRQFAAALLVVFGGTALWRFLHEDAGTITMLLAAVALGVGLTGLIAPRAIRYVFTGWMMAAFPIGWTISHVVLALLFYGLFTPVALLFRLTGRDVLHRRRQDKPTYWMPKPPPRDVREYFRQY